MLGPSPSSVRRIAVSAHYGVRTQKNDTRPLGHAMPTV